MFDMKITEEQRSDLLTALVRAITRLVEDGRTPKAAAVKPALVREMNGRFDERLLGFRTFRDFLTWARDEGAITLQSVGVDLEVIPVSSAIKTEGGPPKLVVGPHQGIRSDLWRAWVDWSPTTRRYYDRAMERAIIVPENDAPGQPHSTATLREAVMSDPSRFVEIAGISEDETMSQMRTFAESITDPGTREELIGALTENARPASSFRRIVQREANLASEWHQFRAQLVADSISAWATKNQVHLANIVRDPQPRYEQHGSERLYQRRAGNSTPDDGSEASLRARVLDALARMPTSELLRLRVPAEYLLR